MAPKRPKLDANPIPWQEFLTGYRVAMSALMGEGAPAPVQTVDDKLPRDEISQAYPGRNVGPRAPFAEASDATPEATSGGTRSRSQRPGALLRKGPSGDVPDHASPDAIVPPGAAISPELRAKLERDPYSRVLLALRDHFGPDYPYYRAFLYRFWSLYDLVHRNQVPEFAQAKGDGTLGLHPALLLAAADVKLTKKGRFPLNRFRDRVVEIIARELKRATQAAADGPPADSLRG